jgi:hypothetical protein
MYQSKKHFLMHLRASTPLFVAIGFSVGGAVHFLFLRSWDLASAILGAGASGAIGGAFLAHRSHPQRSAILVATAYGLGFALGGSISVTILWLQLENPSLPFIYFYPLFILGFCSAGATSAALIRPRLIAVRNSTISFLVGSAVGGIVLAVLLGSPMDRPHIAAMGLLISYAVGGAVSGMVLESLERE